MLLALKYIHSKNIIHRDVKPQNILCTKPGLLKLSDFGISTQLEGDLMARTSVGTPYYLAPELVAAEPYSYSADVWMLGCTLYELCALNRPFAGSSIQEILLKICNQSIDESQMDGYSDWLKRSISEMLDKDPAKRPTVNALLDSKEMRDELRSLAKEFPEAYKDLISTSKGRKRDLELDIQEPAERMVGTKGQSVKKQQTSSTKHGQNDNSIFSIIERAKAKSNGTTPQNAINLTPSNTNSQADQTPASKKILQRPPKLCSPSDELGMSSLTGYCYNDSESKRPREFITPTSLEQTSSPLTAQLIQKKKVRNGFSFISSIFGKQNPQSPARITLAKKFLKEKLGDELFGHIERMSESDPKTYLLAAKELLGQDLRHVLPVVEYVFGKENKNLPSPISNCTESTQAPPVHIPLNSGQIAPHQEPKDNLSLTFGFGLNMKQQQTQGQ